MILSIPPRQVANILFTPFSQQVRRATTRPYNHSGEHEVAKKTTSKRKEYTTDDVKLLKAQNKPARLLPSSQN